MRRLPVCSFQASFTGQLDAPTIIHFIFEATSFHEQGIRHRMTGQGLKGPAKTKLIPLQGWMALISRKLSLQLPQPLRGNITESHNVQDAGPCPKVSLACYGMHTGQEKASSIVGDYYLILLLRGYTGN